MPQGLALSKVVPKLAQQKTNFHHAAQYFESGSGLILAQPLSLPLWFSSVKRFE